MKFHKYHALGNSYLVLEPGSGAMPSTALVKALCDRHTGIGSDGVLLGAAGSGGGFSLRIFNPDGSEAEKSGNGLRIFARYLWDQKRIGGDPVEIATVGGLTVAHVQNRDRIAVEMGVARFGPIDVEIEADGQMLRFTAVDLGNPHCVILVDDPAPALVQRLGPILERHRYFPNRTNVQFVEVIDRRRLRLEIWERGAGYTLASGSSSCAAAAACVRQGLCDGEITVMMPGGELAITVAADFAVRMVGPACKIAEGTVASELIDGTVGRERASASA